jgi:hypothetical protein
MAAKFVPSLLTSEQKEQHSAICQEFLLVNDKESFLKNILMAVEMWVYGYDI